MNYDVKLPILGFEDIETIKLEKVDDLFVTIRDANNEDISLTLANPYLLREYSIDLPLSIKTLLDMNEKTNFKVFNVVVIQSPLDTSRVNFLAPLVFNEDNNTVAQVVLDAQKHPDFGMAESIRELLDKKA